MTTGNDTERAFLFELYNRTGGDASVQTSMHDVGAAIGLDRERAGKIAEDLIGKGWVEIKTLSGGVGITAEGVEAARQAGAAPAGGSDLTLSAGPLLNAEDRRMMDKILADIKQAVRGLKSDYAGLEEIAMDIKTAEVQLLSPRAKTGIVKEILRALQGALDKAGAEETTGRIARMLG